MHIRPAQQQELIAVVVTAREHISEGAIAADGEEERILLPCARTADELA